MALCSPSTRLCRRFTRLPAARIGTKSALITHVLVDGNRLRSITHCERRDTRACRNIHENDDIRIMGASLARTECIINVVVHMCAHSTPIVFTGLSHPREIITHQCLDTTRRSHNHKPGGFDTLTHLKRIALRNRQSMNINVHGH